MLMPCVFEIDARTEEEAKKVEKLAHNALAAHRDKHKSEKFRIPLKMARPIVEKAISYWTEESRTKRDADHKEQAILDREADRVAAVERKKKIVLEVADAEARARASVVNRLTKDVPHQQHC